MDLLSGRALLGLLCILHLAQRAVGQPGMAEKSRWFEQDEADQSAALIQQGVHARRSLHSLPNPHGWVVIPELGQRAYFDLHIPKTAGTSFSRDVGQVLPQHEGYFSEEMCWYTPKPTIPGDEMMAFVREPTGHIYSQYLECRYDFDWQPAKNRNNPAMRSVTTWLKHFEGGTVHDALGCYDPYNMQTRAFTCTETFFSGGGSHIFHGEPDLATAIKNFDSLFFVGITEQYHASVCLFFAKTHANTPLPPHCDCTDKVAWNAWHGHYSNHHEPPHSLGDLSEEDLRMIRELSRLDAQLYAHALGRFRREAAEVEATRGTKILCESEEQLPGPGVHAS